MSAAPPPPPPRLGPGCLPPRLSLWDNRSFIRRYADLGDAPAVDWGAVLGDTDSSKAVCVRGTNRVLVVLIDAISRPLFLERYKSTLRFLRSRPTHQLHAFGAMQTHGRNSLPNKYALWFNRTSGGPRSAAQIGIRASS